MLQDLHIQNFALIDNLQIQFQPGLNILTGETGAGKSIIIDALDMLLGGRASADFIRTGHSKAVIEALFDVKNPEVEAMLNEMGLELENGQILLAREITESGNNRLRINGQMASRNMVKDISKYLLDIHGQHEHQTLMNKAEHLRLLDGFGGTEIAALRDETARLYGELAAIRRELKALRQNEQEKNQRIDLLKYQIEEMDQAAFSVEEELEMNNRRKVLMNAEKLFQNANQVTVLFQGDDYENVGLMELVGKLLRHVEEMLMIDQSLVSVKQMVESAYFQLQEASYEMGGYEDRIEFDPDELMKIEERLTLLSRLKRKYGSSVQEILDYRKQIGEELSNLTHSEERIEELQAEAVKTMQRYVTVAQKLSELRRDVGLQFSWRVMREMADLSMPNAKFAVQVDWQDDADGVEADGRKVQFGPDGIDQVEFMISPNPGEEMKPLIRIASGGEISRIMLAIKAVTIGLEQVDSVIFDEIDSGVGGEAGQRVAEKLALIAKDRQVICITHLPQIAAMADAQYYIYKEVQENRTRSNIVQLTETERIEELARMYGGVEVAAARDHAAAMLEIARKKKAEL